MNIKDEYIKIIQYLHSKLLSGQFEFINATEYCAVVEIDGMSFNVWIANGPTSCSLYAPPSSLFGEIPDILTDDEKINLSNQLMPLVSAYRKSVLIKLKREELKALERSLGNK